MKFPNLPNLIFLTGAAPMPDLLARRDAFYTPPSVAERLADAIVGSPKSVLDPSVGDGSLLVAASRRWPDADMYGLDIDGDQLKQNRQSHPHWNLGRMDMFSSRSRAASRIWNGLHGSVECAVLNPPFSYRGGQTVPATFAGRTYRLTPASAFVAHAASALSPSGQIAAVLPAGILSLERDAEFWLSLREHGTVHELETFSSTTFKGTRAKSTLVAVTMGGSGATGPPASTRTSPTMRFCVEVVRGRVPVHRVSGMESVGSLTQFLHSSDLARQHPNDRVVLAPSHLGTVGPFVALPRVGRVRREQVRLVSHPAAVVLSDCVFALRAATDADLLSLERIVLDDLEDLQARYTGPCAPYLTLRRLSDFLGERGLCAHVVRASGDPEFPRCPSVPEDADTESLVAVG